MSGVAGGATIAQGREPTGHVTILGFGRSRDEVLVHTGSAQHDTIQALRLGGGPAAESYDVDEAGRPLFDPETRLWIGSTGDGEHQPAQMFAPDQQTRLVSGVTAFPDQLTRLVSYSTGLRRLILFTMGQKDSGTYWFVDLDRRSATALGGEYPSVAGDQVGPVSWISYQASDGLAMRGVLTLPPGRPAMDLPLVVMPHGGPEDHDRPKFDYWAQAFASRGYAVFQPNFRGSDGFGVAFRDAGFGQWGRRMQTDISDGVAELARRGIVDPKRACIVGWSYGGYAALAGVTVQQGLYRCAVAVGGVADPAAFLDFQRDAHGPVGAVTRFWKRYLGVEDGGEAQLSAISPRALAGRADAPILLIHGRDDTIVPVEQSQAMAEALRSAGKPVKLTTLPGADHWLLEEPARIAMVKASVAFVMRNDSPEPARASAQVDTAKLH
jgi:dipeptidyl aminopeptidase/acylaminoacyl peptidase